MDKIEQLGKYVEASRISTNRTRTSLIVIVTACILIFAAFWNSYQRSWTNLRISRISTAISLKVWDTTYRNKIIDSTMLCEYDASREFIIQRNIRDSTTLKSILDELRQFQIKEIINIHVPFFGITIDVNDLGIASGTTFFVLMMWLRLCLFREIQNISQTFAKAKELDMQNDCYDLLSMHQLFTIPHVQGVGKKFLIKKIPQVLITLPLLVHTIVLINDFYSFIFGSTINHTSAVIVLSISVLSFISILLATISCFKLAARLDKTWILP